jgi:peptidoglycan hydrolase-like protein with peptidoglycan-binding domain
MFRASALALALIATPWVAAQADEPAGRLILAQAQSYTGYDIQNALGRAGYYNGPIDGAMGPGTRRALSAFQSDNGLPVTGTPTNSTLGALRNQGYLVAGGAYDSGGSDALVSDVQAALREQGYGVRVSGMLDPNTRTAIRSYQRRQGLPVTGRPTPELLALMQQGGGGGYADGQSGLVRRIQERLTDKGYDVGPVDGVMHRRTERAIRIYQEQRGLPVTGSPSPDLLVDLRNSTVTAQSARVPQTPEEAMGTVLQGLGQRLQNR